MAVVQLLRRVHEARMPVAAADAVQAPLWPLQGRMHPNLCPAIRDANVRGLLLCASHDLNFDGPDSFDVRVGLMGDDEVLVVPGVIGSPDSTILFAKVDTGFSVDDLPVEWLSLPVLNLEFSLDLIVPGVIYPKGYCGPLFVAVAARTQVRIPAGYPLTQLIAIDGREPALEISGTLRRSRADADFQGLLRPGWRDVERVGQTLKARRCLDLFMRQPQEEVLRSLQNRGQVEDGIIDPRR
jgi:hypothetical protein